MRPLRRSSAVVGAVALVAMPAALAGGASGPSPGAPAHPAPTAERAVRAVVIDDSRMSPAAIVVAPGTRITWTNAGRARHTSTADAGAWDSPALSTGQSFTLAAPAATGSYGYHCRFHSYIRGTVTVSPVDLAQPAPVAVGGRARVRGTVPGVPEGTAVRIERRRPGVWEPVAEVTTDGEGAFTALLPALSRRTAVRAAVGAVVSPSRRIAVRPRVAVTLRRSRLVVRVRPASRRQSLVLERLDLDTYRWHPHGARRLRRPPAAAFRLHRPGVYRVLVVGRAGLADTRSAPVEFRPALFRIG